MSWNWITFTIVICLACWRAVWLAAGIPDTTEIADDIRSRIVAQLGPPEDACDVPPERWRVSLSELDVHPANPRTSFEIVRIGVDQWDAHLPIWITPGRDRQPGWAGWDDNGDGITDEPGELGAAWSDDDCVVAIPGELQPEGRVIDHGAFRPILPAAAIDARRVRFNAVYIRDAP